MTFFEGIRIIVELFLFRLVGDAWTHIRQLEKDFKCKMTDTDYKVNRCIDSITSLCPEGLDLDLDE